jgi:CBS domain-containing protein
VSDKKARDVMSTDVTCVGENETLLDAARKLAELDVGSLPICGEDDRLKGMLTDRDIVVKALAQGKDPGSTKAGELGQGDGKAVTIGADDSIDEGAAHDDRPQGPPAPGDRRQAARRHHQPGRRSHQRGR